MLDVLGRPIVAIAHNKRRVRRPDGTVTYVDEFIPTHTELDAQGRTLVIYDGRRCEGLDRAAAIRHRGNAVMRYTYGFGAAELHQDGMDAGERWALADIAGNPQRSWDARGHHITTEYDRLRRPTHVRVDAAGTRTTSERIVYGDQLDRASARRANLLGRAVLYFDGAGLLEQVAVDFKGNATEVRRSLPVAFDSVPDWSSLDGLEPAAMVINPLLETERYATRSAYDALDRETHTTTPDNTTQVQSFNKAGSVEATAATLRGAATSTRFVTAVATNARGQRTLVQYANGVVTENTFDPETFRLSQKVSSGPGGAVLQDLSYRYDAAGNIVEVRDDSIEPVFFRNERVEAASRYLYDSLQRLVEASGRESAASRQRPANRDIDIHPNIPAHDGSLRNYTELYDYDPVGNIERVRHIADGGRWTRVYDCAADSNRLAATGDEGAPLDERYPHDIAGNMTSLPHLTALHWDHADQLRHAEIAPHDDLYCHYDSGRQRARKLRVKDGNRTERVYLGGYEVHRSASGTLETLHVALDGDRLCMVETPDGGSSRFRFQLSNHLGSATIELDEDAVPISYEEYHPYGTTAFRANNGTPLVSPKRYRYTGMERDEETGLAYHTARYYASWLGRWCSSDPAGLAGGSNLFEYSHDAPISYTDRGGEDPRAAVASGVTTTTTTTTATAAETLPLADATTSGVRAASRAVRPSWGLRAAGWLARGAVVVVLAVAIVAVGETIRLAVADEPYRNCNEHPDACAQIAGRELSAQEQREYYYRGDEIYVYDRRTGEWEVRGNWFRMPGGGSGPAGSSTPPGPPRPPPQARTAPAPAPAPRERRRAAQSGLMTRMRLATERHRQARLERTDRIGLRVNYGAIAYRDARGVVHVLVRGSRTGVGHSEERLISVVRRRLGDDFNDRSILGIYSELEPCGDRCAPAIRAAAPHAEVGWRWDYNEDGREQRHRDLTFDEAHHRGEIDYDGP